MAITAAAGAPPGTAVDPGETHAGECAPVVLIPWDPDAPAHVERLRLQRVTCGWKVENVEAWRALQREGKMGLHWIVLPPAHANTAAHLGAHRSAFPAEAAPLADSGAGVFGRPARAGSARAGFVPVGHVALDAAHDDARMRTDPAAGVYSLTTFYVSRALHGRGLGSAAMDAIERMAVEDFGATAITLNTIANSEVAIDSPRRIALQRPIPRVTNHDWYQRRGYVAYDHKADAWFDVDSTGRAWGTACVYMQKQLRPQSATGPSQRAA